jgi:hypothetical protein
MKSHSIGHICIFSRCFCGCKGESWGGGVKVAQFKAIGDGR